MTDATCLVKVSWSSVTMHRFLADFVGGFEAELSWVSNVVPNRGTGWESPGVQS